MAALRALSANQHIMDEEEKKGFTRQFAEKVQQNILSEFDRKREREAEAMKNWRSWGSWFSWGSPVGLGLFLLSIGAFLVLLHYAGLIG